MTQKYFLDCHFQVKIHCCDFGNLLSFTYQLFPSPLEINHMIQEPTEANLKQCRAPKRAFTRSFVGIFVQLKTHVQI